MYSYEWHTKSRAYKLSTKTGKFVASEIRPVYADELNLLNAQDVFEYNHDEALPLMWAKHNSYYYRGKEVARIKKSDDGGYALNLIESTDPIRLTPVDVNLWLAINSKIMNALVADTLKRIKEMYELYKDKTDVCYIGFSGGKDSMVLLDLCHKVLPLSVPVIYSDTDMELPDSYSTWEAVCRRYAGRPFKMVRANSSALENWSAFGPPSQNLRWCCAVHKSTPAILYLRELAQSPNARTLAYVGVRSDESIRRSAYDDIGDGLKNQSQVNAMPILNWGAHELFLYTYAEKLIINSAYRKGLPRVGCLLCPMSMERQVDLIRKLYPNDTVKFENAIKETITREFASESDFEAFIYRDKGWHARQSGVSLRKVIQSPSLEHKNNHYKFSFDSVSKDDLLEWMKTIGKIELSTATNRWTLMLTQEMVEFSLTENGSGVIGIDLEADARIISRSLLKYIRTSICKSLGCIGCRACESECPTGALSFANGVHVDTRKCIHCMRCHATNDGCMRYFSLRYAGGTTVNISGINKYMTFGLKKDWIEILIQEREDFRHTTNLGVRMIPSAVTWFREASLISEATAISPTRLLDVAINNGVESDNEALWAMIWMSLANKSPLVRWFVCSTEIDRSYTPDELNEMLHKSVASDSVRKGALQSLFATFKGSPIGTGNEAFVQTETKGVRVTSVKRIVKHVDPFALLFSLYLVGKIADRTSFTISEMMTASFDSPFVSPLVAFGMSVEEFKAQCLGISSIHPDFLSCSFTLGLDEIKIFPNEKSVDDVLGLIIGE